MKFGVVMSLNEFTQFLCATSFVKQCFLLYTTNNVKIHYINNKSDQEMTHLLLTLLTKR